MIRESPRTGCDHVVRLDRDCPAPKKRPTVCCRGYPAVDQCGRLAKPMTAGACKRTRFRSTQFAIDHASDHGLANRDAIDGANNCAMHWLRFDAARPFANLPLFAGVAQSPLPTLPADERAPITIRGWAARATKLSGLSFSAGLSKVTERFRFPIGALRNSPLCRASFAMPRRILSPLLPIPH